MTDPVYSRPIHPAELDHLATMPGVQFQVRQTPVYEGRGWGETLVFGTARVWTYQTADEVRARCQRIPLCDDLTVLALMPAAAVEAAAGALTTSAS